MLIISGKNETLNGPFPLIHSFAFYYIFNKEQKIVLPLGSCIAHLCGSVKKFRHLVSFCFRMCVVRNRFKCVNYHHHGYEQNPSVFSKGKNLPYFVYLSWHFCLFCLSENFVIVVACVCVCVVFMRSIIIIKMIWRFSKFRMIISILSNTNCCCCCQSNKKK